MSAAVLPGHEDWVKCLAYKSPAREGDPLILASGSQDATIRLWNIEPFTRSTLSSSDESGDRATDELLDHVYRASTALIAASEGEGFGLPLVEAAQRGLPILARNLPVFREVAGDHAFFFEGTTSEGLAAEIDQWVGLHASDSHPGSQGMGWSTWNESARMLWKLLRSKAAARSKAPSVSIQP